MLRVFAPKVRGIFGLKTQKTGLGMAMIAIPKPIFSGFTVFWAVFALKARKLPDLSGRQIRQSIWQGKKASNPRPTVLETAALPAELFPFIMVGLQGLEPQTDRL